MIEISDEAWTKLWSRTDTSKTDECWAWDGVMSGGTPMFFIARPGRRGLNASARRVIWDQLHPDDPLMKDQVITVSCEDRSCVNPGHFERMSRKEFAVRSGSMAATNRNRTHCKNGHEFTEENTYTRSDGRGRQCRMCARDHVQKHRARSKGDEVDPPAAP